jgi:Fe2+ transport system protein FeoA
MSFLFSKPWKQGPNPVESHQPGAMPHSVPGQPDFCTRRLCPLNRFRAGAAVRVKQLCASPETVQRLREIGLGEEQIVKLLTCEVNVICLVCNARLALSKHLAEAILVEPVEQTAAVSTTEQNPCPPGRAAALRRPRAVQARNTLCPAPAARWTRHRSTMTYPLRIGNPCWESF